MHRPHVQRGVTEWSLPKRDYDDIIIMFHLEEKVRASTLMYQPISLMMANLFSDASTEESDYSEVLHR